MNSIACNAIESSSIRLQTKVKIFRSEIIKLLVFLCFCLTALYIIVPVLDSHIIRQALINNGQ